MSVTSNIASALESSKQDDVLVRHFLEVWPLITSILGSFSEATHLPMFVFLANKLVFQSSHVTMPLFCQRMLESPDTKGLCFQDALRRAQKKEPEKKHHVQFCHAGMYSVRREIHTGCVGTLVILFGARKGNTKEASQRADRLLLTLDDQILRAELERLRVQAKTEISKSELGLMDSIVAIISQLLNATILFRFLSINMAHELSAVMLGIGLLSRQLEIQFKGKLKKNSEDESLTEFDPVDHILAESRLALYVVRNFLSHTSEHRLLQGGSFSTLRGG